MAEVVEAPAEPKAEPVAPVVEEKPVEKAPEKTYTQADLDRITAKVKKNAAYRARKEAEAYFKGLQQGTAIVKPAEQAKPDDRPPERGDFPSYEDFMEAKAAYVGKKAAREERAEAEKEAKARQAEETRTKTLQSFQAKVREKYPDLESKFDDAAHINMPEGMGDAIAESDFGPDILNHLMSNIEDFERIAALSPSAALRELGKLEAKLEQASKPSGAGKQEPVKPASKAPEPIKPGGGAAPTDESPSDKDNIEDWMRKERARLRKKHS